MGYRGGYRANPPEHSRSLTSASEGPGKYGRLTGTAGQGSGTGRPVFRKREIYYLAKLSSEPGARGATAEGESENTSTSNPPEEAGGPTGAGGAAPRPRRSADGEGVDWKTGKESQCRSFWAEAGQGQVPTTLPPPGCPLGGAVRGPGRENGSAQSQA